jgi:hypothetical protein
MLDTIRIHETDLRCSSSADAYALYPIVVMEALEGPIVLDFNQLTPSRIFLWILFFKIAINGLMDNISLDMNDKNQLKDIQEVQAAVIQYTKTRKDVILNAEID